MELTKTTSVDRIEYLPEANVIQVREIIRVMEGDTVLASSYNRYTVDATTDPVTITDDNVLKAYTTYFG